MEKEEINNLIKRYIQDNLTITIKSKKETEYCAAVKITLYLDDIVISSDTEWIDV